jgi:hypothetical protein
MYVYVFEAGPKIKDYYNVCSLKKEGGREGGWGVGS